MSSEKAGPGDLLATTSEGAEVHVRLLPEPQTERLTTLHTSANTQEPGGQLTSPVPLANRISFVTTSGRGS